MPEQITFDKFKEVPDGEIFARGTLPNSPDGIFMTSAGGELDWIAKKGYGNDWAIYCYWKGTPEFLIERQGQKVANKANILRCLIVSDEMLRKYRY